MKQPNKKQKIVEYYREHPDIFIKKRLGIKLWSGMRIIIDAVWKHKRVSVRACHGISKTICAATIAITFFNLYKNAIVITTAPTFRQVNLLLWKEIRHIYSQNNNFLRGECLTVDIKTATDSYVVGFSTDRADAIEGFHSPHILWILDEAKGLPQWVYDAIEGSMTGGFAKVLEISTTDGADQQCPLRKHQSEKRGKWHCIKLSAFDSPFVAVGKFPEYQKHINKKLYDYGKPITGREWPKKLENKMQICTTLEIKDKEDLWKEKRPDLWETKILGDFSSEGTSNVIPLKWVESAINAEVDDGDGITCYGFDIARMGDDMTVLTPKTGKRLMEAIVWGKKKTTYTTGIAIQETALEEIIKIDADGMGSGVYDRLAELGHAVIGLRSGKNAFDEIKFENLKAEMWWNAREIFERQYERGNVISIPDDPELIEDLTGCKYIVKSNGRIIMEKKDDYKKRLGRSPDKGDSAVYCLYEPPVMADEYYGEADDDTDIFL